jgi:hypothetical protein
MGIRSAGRNPECALVGRWRCQCVQLCQCPRRNRARQLGVSEALSYPCESSFAYLSPVGSFPTNPFGLFDMLGNVFQWTEDCLNLTLVGRPSDQRAASGGDCGHHMLRGGSWITLALYVRSGNRQEETADYRSDFIGFRVARNL